MSLVVADTRTVSGNDLRGGVLAWTDVIQMALFAIKVKASEIQTRLVADAWKALVLEVALPESVLNEQRQTRDSIGVME